MTLTGFSRVSWRRKYDLHIRYIFIRDFRHFDTLVPQSWHWGSAAIAGILVCFVEVLAAGSGIPEIKCFLLLGSEGQPRRADGNSTRWNFHEFERPPNVLQTPSKRHPFLQDTWNIMKHEQYSYRRLYWHCLNDCAKITSATLQFGGLRRRDSGATFLWCVSDWCDCDRKWEAFTEIFTSICFETYF